MRQIIGVVTQRCQGHAEDDLNRLLLVVARADEIVELLVADIAFVVHHGQSKLRQLVSFRVVQGAGVAQSGD